MPHRDLNDQELDARNMDAGETANHLAGNRWRAIRVALLSLGLALSGGMLLTGCDEQGPAEEAGEEIDEAVEEAGDKVEEAADKIEEETDDG